MSFHFLVEQEVSDFDEVIVGNYWVVLKVPSFLCLSSGTHVATML